MVMAGSLSTATMTVTCNLTTAATAVWAHVGECWLRPGWHGWRLPCPPNRATATIWVAIRWRFLGFGFGFGYGLVCMVCTMHFRGCPLYVGGCHPAWLAWHPSWVSMAPCGPLLFLTFYFWSFAKFALSPGVCHPTATWFSHMKGCLHAIATSAANTGGVSCVKGYSCGHATTSFQIWTVGFSCLSCVSSNSMFRGSLGMCVFARVPYPCSLHATPLASLHHWSGRFSWLSLIVARHIRAYAVVGLTICRKSYVIQLLPSSHNLVLGQIQRCSSCPWHNKHPPKMAFRLGQCFFKADICGLGHQFHASRSC